MYWEYVIMKRFAINKSAITGPVVLLWAVLKTSKFQKVQQRPTAEPS